MLATGTKRKAEHFVICAVCGSEISEFDLRIHICEEHIYYFPIRCSGCHLARFSCVEKWRIHAKYMCSPKKEEFECFPVEAEEIRLKGLIEGSCNPPRNFEQARRRQKLDLNRVTDPLPVSSPAILSPPKSKNNHEITVPILDANVFKTFQLAPSVSSAQKSKPKDVQDYSVSPPASSNAESCIQIINVKSETPSISDESESLSNYAAGTDQQTDYDFPSSSQESLGVNDEPISEENLAALEYLRNVSFPLEGDLPVDDVGEGLTDFPAHIRNQPRVIGRTEQELPFRQITGYMHKKALSWANLRGKKCRESAYMFQLLRQLYPEEDLLTTIIVKQRNCRTLMDLFTSNVMAIHYVLEYTLRRFGYLKKMEAAGDPKSLERDQAEQMVCKIAKTSMRLIYNNLCTLRMKVLGDRALQKACRTMRNTGSGSYFVRSEGIFTPEAEYLEPEAPPNQ